MLSVSNAWRDAGHETLTLDIDPKCMPDICTDIMSWEYTDFSLEPPDFIWCSPPCTHYSIARTKAKKPRDLEGSDAIVQQCLDIIAFWRPRYWVIENPQTGLLKTRDIVQGLIVIPPHAKQGQLQKKRSLLLGPPRALRTLMRPNRVLFK